MTDNEMPADWAIEKALKLREFNDGYCLDDVKKAPSIFATVVAFARYIEAHEEPPISRELLCAREAAARLSNDEECRISKYWRSGKGDGVLKLAVDAIQLFNSGYGKTDG